MNNFTESLPKSGHVNEVCKEWLVREDGALAYKLQSQEITDFYKGNRFRNAVVREDFPTALHEQIKEAENAEKQAEAYRRRLLEQEEHDKRVANEISQKLERDLREQQQKELQESELIAQQMQEIYVNLPPVPPPASRDKSRPPPRPAKASTLQQQAQNASEPNGRYHFNQASSNQQLLHQQHQQFANTDNYVGLSLAQNIVNQQHQTPTRHKTSASPHAPTTNHCNGYNHIVVSDAGSPPTTSSARHTAAAVAAATTTPTPIILSNEHFISQPQQQSQQYRHQHQHSSSNVSTNSSTKSSASSSARRNVFEYHNLPNQPITPTTLHSPLPPHTPNTPITPSTHLNSITSTSTHSDIDELIEYSDVADSIRRYDITDSQSPLVKDALDSLHSHPASHSTNFNRIMSPSNENLLRNDHKFQKLSPEKYDQLVGNEGQASAAATANERQLQEHADDIELYVDPCDYTSLQEIGLPMEEIKEISKKLKQEQKDELLARRLQQMEATDGLTQEERDRLLAIEAQDKELAKMLQEREKAKIKRAKEKARQRKNQQKEAANASGLCSPTTNGGSLHCGPLLTLPQDCLNACNPHAKRYADSSPQHQQAQPRTPTTLLDDDPLDMEAYSNPIDVIQQQNQTRPTNGLLTNGSLTRDKPNITRLQASRSQNDDDIYTLPVDSCRNGTQNRPTSLQVTGENTLAMATQHNSMTRSENYALEAHETLNGHDITPRMAYSSKPSTFDQNGSPTPPYMPIQGSRRSHTGEDRKKKSKDSKCTHQ